MRAGRPLHVDVPDQVQALLAGRSYDVVWRNELGGLTFEVLLPGGGRQFLKWAPAGSGIDLAREVSRLRWAAPYIRVPQVLDSGVTADGAWMLTAGLAGSNAVSARWIDDPSTAVTAIGQGLRAVHDTLPVAHCPFGWSADERVADAHRRTELGRIDVTTWHADHQGVSLAEALRIVDDPPPVDHLVVCHADPCAPNTLIGESGRCSGHVDLGSLGLADRWADLAIATWSVTWNYGPGWERHLLAAYGVQPDAERTRYYRLLWELGP